MGSLRISCFLTEGLVGYSSEPFCCLPKSTGAYPFPQSVTIRCFFSGPISVDPIRLRPSTGRGSEEPWRPMTLHTISSSQTHEAVLDKERQTSGAAQGPAAVPKSRGARQRRLPGPQREAAGGASRT